MKRAWNLHEERIRSTWRNDNIIRSISKEWEKLMKRAWHHDKESMSSRWKDKKIDMKRAWHLQGKHDTYKKIKKRSTRRKYKVYIKRSYDLHEKEHGSTRRYFKIYKKRSWYQHKECIRSRQKGAWDQHKKIMRCTWRKDWIYMKKT